MSSFRSLTRIARPVSKLAPVPLLRPLPVPFVTSAVTPAASAVVAASSSHRSHNSDSNGNGRQRFNSNNNSQSASADNSRFILAAAAAAVTAAAAGSEGWAIDGTDPTYQAQVRAHEPAIRAAIEALLDEDDYDGHGSYGPSFVRLAWHSSGTYDKTTNTGGSNGATMRFSPESGWGANNGLNLARDRLESVKKQFPFVSYADLWTLAGVVATEAMGGPVIPWRPGRSEALPGTVAALPGDRLPDGGKGAGHVRDIFYRMGFDDREITALIGAHAVGKTHRKFSGYDGPWTRAPTTFSNQFYTTLKDEKWRVRKWDGPEQYENEGGKDLMMLPADMAFLWDPEFRKWVDVYAESEEKFFEDYSKAFQKLTELGVPAFHQKKSKWIFW